MATAREPVRRYQREHPGELIHVDIKKLAAIPPGGGWWIHGRGNDWTSEHQRAEALTGFIHFYNHHRSHGSLGWATPMDTIRDNLPAMHT